MLSEVNQSNSSEKKATIYQKIGLLSIEIQEELKNISDAPRSQVSNDIEVIREISYQERAPEAEFVIRLFRRYAIQAQSLKTGKGGKESIFHRSIHMGKAQISSLHTEANYEKLAGFAAFKHQLFWLRVITLLISFIAYVVMATVPNISVSVLRPSDYFTSGCPIDHMVGYFDYRAYRLVLAAAILAFIHSFFLIMYYVLPLDQHGRKVVPGLEDFCSECLHHLPERCTVCIGTCVNIMRMTAKLVEMVMDVALAAMMLAACLIASIVLERGASFDLGNNLVTYFTIGTFYSTYSHTYPVCIGEDPGPKIRGSMAMSYLTLFVLTLCAQSSTRAFYKSLRPKEGKNPDTKEPESGNRFLLPSDVDDDLEEQNL